jgi:hypothetical protein
MKQWTMVPSLLASAALLLGSPTAFGAIAHPSAASTVKPSVSIDSAARSGKTVKFVIDLSFPLPQGALAAACKGKIKASAKLGHGKTASWSGALKAKSTFCDALIHAKLPKSKFGKKVAFKLSFKGSSAIKAFTISKKLSIKKPTPPGGTAPGGTTPGGTTPGGTPPGGGGTPPVGSPVFKPGGHWFGQLDNPSHSAIDFYTSDTAVTSFSTVPSVPIPCATDPASAASRKGFIASSPFTGGGAFAGNASDGTTTVHVTGTLTDITASGTITIDTTQSMASCHLSANWTANWGPP